MYKAKRLQSAIELISVYSWAFIILGIFVAAVLVITSNPPQNYVSSSCFITPSFNCEGTILTTYSRTSPITYMILFNNGLGSPIYFAQNAINLTTTNIGYVGIQYTNGTCSPRLASIGARVLCTVTLSGTQVPPLGSMTSTRFLITYEICNANNITKCPNEAYQTTGNSYQELSDSTANFESITLYTSPGSGLIYMNGIAYVNNTTIEVASGNYVIYASPPTSYTFNSWNPFGLIGVSSSSSQNTTLIVNGYGSITANFIK